MKQLDELGRKKYALIVKPANIRQIQLVRQLPGLCELHVDATGSGVEQSELSEWFAEIARCENIVLLCVDFTSSPGIDHRTLAPIASMRNLRHLDIWGNYGNELPPLPSGLETFRVGEGRISGDDYDAIAGLTLLRSLEFSWATFDAPQFSRWNELRQFEEFNICNVEKGSIIDADRLRFIKGLPLRRIVAVSDGIDDRIAELLIENNQLRDLTLCQTSITDEAVRKLLEYCRLETLDLSCTRVTDRGFDRIAEKQELRRLYLSDAGITDITLNKLRHLKNLQSLDISRTQCTALGLHSISELTEIESLGIFQIPIDDRVIDILASLSRLKWLNLLACDGLTEKHLLQLMTSQSLETLILLKDDFVTDEFIETLTARNNRVKFETLSPEDLR